MICPHHDSKYQYRPLARSCQKLKSLNFSLRVTEMQRNDISCLFFPFSLFFFVSFLFAFSFCSFVFTFLDILLRQNAERLKVRFPSIHPSFYSTFIYFCLLISWSIYPSIYIYLFLSIPNYLYPSISIYTYLYLSVSICIYLHLSVSICIYLYLSISICIHLLSRSFLPSRSSSRQRFRTQQQLSEGKNKWNRWRLRTQRRR